MTIAWLLLALPLVRAWKQPGGVYKHGHTCTVVPFGGGQDDGPTILSAFAQCNNGGKVVLDEYYVVNTVLVHEPLQDVEIELSGVMQYTPNIAYWSPNSLYLAYQNATTYWFLNGNNIHLHGGGTIDGNGQVWWDYPNVTTGTAGGSSTVFARPIPLTVGNASNVLVEDITQIGSPFWNNLVYQSTNVTYRNMNISTTSYSQKHTSNSDGWDVYRSSYVTIEDCTVHNADDCVSFKPNSTNVLVRNMVCSGGDGMSVGSLGQYVGTEDHVANVTVSNITLSNSGNAAHIKVFGGSPNPKSTQGGGHGYVKNVTFSDMYLTNVKSPLLIEGCYSTPVSCAQYPSNVIISDITYKNIHGTTPSSLIADLNCTSPCTNLYATMTNLTSSTGTGSYFCANVANSQLDFNCSSSSA